MPNGGNIGKGKTQSLSVAGSGTGKRGEFIRRGEAAAGHCQGSVKRLQCGFWMNRPPLWMR